MSHKRNLKVRALAQMGTTKDNITAKLNDLFPRRGTRTDRKQAAAADLYLNGRKRV